MKSSIPFCVSSCRCRHGAKLSFVFVPPEDDLDGVDLEIAHRAAAEVRDNRRAVEKPRTAASHGRKAQEFWLPRGLSFVARTGPGAIFCWPLRQIDGAALRANDLGDCLKALPGMRVSIASPLDAAFPKWPEGRHPHCHFRGLLRLHSHYGPSDRSAAQGDLCHEAPAQPVTRPSRSSATGSIDNSPGEIFLH